ncbi:MAG TPA: transcription-repair coupling factor, partial [Flavobacteriia bacterium]|nr:transcription-repair coupling factor [Flavobacteriia bacterium]
MQTNIKTVTTFFTKSKEVTELKNSILQKSQPANILGLVGSSLSFVVSESFKESEKPFLLILEDKETAAYYLNDLEQLLGEKNLLFYPASYRRAYQIEETDNANVLLRAEVLNRINSRRKPAIIVTYPEALFEQVITKKELEKNTLKLQIGDEVNLDFINEVLFEYQFNRVDFVSEPGEFAVRGGIIDVFSYSNDEPYRIEFFGDEIDSIRTFDVETQLSEEKLKKIAIVPNVANKQLEEKRQSFLQYIASKTIIFTKDLDFLKGKLDQLFLKAEKAYQNLQGEINQAKPQELFCNGTLIEQEIKEFTFVSINKVIADKTILFKTKPQPSFNKQFDLVIANFKENTKNGLQNFLFCDNQKQVDRFAEIFND